MPFSRIVFSTVPLIFWTKKIRRSRGSEVKANVMIALNFILNLLGNDNYLVDVFRKVYEVLWGFDNFKLEKWTFSSEIQKISRCAHQNKGG